MQANRAQLMCDQQHLETKTFGTRDNTRDGTHILFIGAINRDDNQIEFIERGLGKGIKPAIDRDLFPIVAQLRFQIFNSVIATLC